MPNKDHGSHAEELRVLTYLQDKLKHHMHAHHCLGEANTDTLLYKLWQKLHDTPSVCSTARLSYTATLCKAPCSVTHFGPWPNVTFKEQEQVEK